MSLSDFALPLFIPGVLFLVAGILMIKNPHHSNYLKYLHALGRFYFALCYFAAAFDLLGLPLSDYQYLLRGAGALLALEEIVIWCIDKIWPPRLKY